MFVLLVMASKLGSDLMCVCVCDEAWVSGAKVWLLRADWFSRQWWQSAVVHPAHTHVQTDTHARICKKMWKNMHTRCFAQTVVAFIKYHHLIRWTPPHTFIIFMSFYFPPPPDIWAPGKKSLTKAVCHIISHISLKVFSQLRKSIDSGSSL